MYRPGRLNAPADALSRNPVEPIQVNLVTRRQKEQLSSEKNQQSNFKVCSWNVNGIRALTKKTGLNYLKDNDFNIIALQETKCDKSRLHLKQN